MEYWNDGQKNKMPKPIIPSFHYSNIPVSLLCGESLRKIISSRRAECQPQFFAGPILSKLTGLSNPNYNEFQSGNFHPWRVGHSLNPQGPILP
jgi:hypothetical protein